MAPDLASPLSKSTPKRVKDDELRATRLKAGKNKFLAFQKKRESSSRPSSTLPTLSNSSLPLPSSKPRYSELNLLKEVVSLRSEIAALRNEINFLRSSPSPPSLAVISPPRPQESVPQEPVPQEPSSQPVSHSLPADTPVLKSKKRRIKFLPGSHP